MPRKRNADAAGNTAARGTPSKGLTLKAYRGDGSALLAFDVDPKLGPDLAGFAIECSPPTGRDYTLLNRLSFAQEITAKTTPAQREWTPTTEGPIQKFHWVDYPPTVTKGKFTYKATAMLFKKGSESAIEPGPTSEVSLELWDEGYGNFDLGFTRGYLSSQAYATRFKNADIEPKPPTIDFDTKPYARRYSWLGSHAGKMIFELLEDTRKDPKLTLDVFAYDFNEPDAIRKLQALGSRLRLFLDNSASHLKGRKKTAPLEVAALAAISRSAGPDNVKVGHFQRYAHNKILIQKRNGKPVKVLSGSANFSVRGLYVQSNSVFVFDDPATAELYEQAFNQAWDDPAGFRKSKIASGWFPDPMGKDPKLPNFQVSFAPHADAMVSLQPVADAIKGANSSVLFAIMEISSGSGPVLQAIRGLPKRKELYAFGTTQNLNGDLKVMAAASKDPVFIPFSYLQSKIPEGFRAEVSGGSGQVIHHKFVVVDFNGPKPCVFAGSSNLTAGGEMENGDNLLAFRDPAICSTYAVEAIRLIDHYRFRAAMKGATKAEPLQLKTRSQNWSKDFFNPRSPKSREREVFVA